MSDTNERPQLSFTRAARKIREVLDKTRRACDPNDPGCPWSCDDDAKPSKAGED